MGNKHFKNHTFVICAYKESSFLEECIKSLKNQSIESEIFIITSTPNSYIDRRLIMEKKELFKIGTLRMNK